MKRPSIYAVAGLLSGCAAALLLVGAAAAAAPSVGDAGPDWSDLPGVDGKQHSLSDYKDAKLLVIVFTCNKCPVAKAYEDRLIALQKRYKSQGVRLVAVCVNDVDGDRLDDMKERAEQKQFNFPYLYDASQKIARDYAATCTPHLFVLDGQRKIAYTGAVDDNNNPQKVAETYLADALDALLAGKQPANAATQQRGCGIKWSKK